MRTILYIKALLSLLALSTGLEAQLYVRAENYTVRSGLSDNRIRCIARDQAGFLWIGTHNGLNRYDGHSFQVFRPSKDNSISNEVINDVVCDSSGYVWVATMDGLNRFDPYTFQWNLWPHFAGEDSTAVLPSNLIRDLYLDPQQRLWVVSDVRELCFIDLGTGRIRRYDWPGFAASDPEIRKTIYRSIQKIIPGPAGILWLGTNRGLVEFDISKGQFRWCGGGYNANVMDMAYDSATGKVLLVTESGDLYSYSRFTGDWWSPAISPIPYPSLRWSEARLSGKRLASPEGLLFWRSTDSRVWLQPYLPLMEGYLHPGGITAVFREAPNVHWLGTPNGISRVDETQEMPRFLPLEVRNFREGSNAMASVYYDETSDSYFVAGGETGKLFQVIVDGDINYFEKDAAGRPFSECHALLADQERRLWLLTVDALYLFERDMKRFRKVKDPPAGYVHNFRDLAVDDEGSVWVAGFSSGVWRYRPPEQKWDSLPGEYFQKVKKPATLNWDPVLKRLWLGSYGSGLYSYSKNEGLLRYAASVQGNGTALDLIHDIVRDSLGRLWVATDAGGIFRLHLQADGQQEWRQFTMRDGLQSNHFISLVPGRHAEIWAISGQRVHHLSSEGQLLAPALTNRVMPVSSFASDQRRPHSMDYDKRRGQVIFAAAGGLMVLPASTAFHQPPFPLIITELNLGNGWLKVFDPHRMRDLDIPFRYNDLDIHYAALQYQTAVAFRYQHRLLGYDREWINPSTAFRATYTNLPPGEYRFAIRVLDATGKPVLESVHYRFHVVPPFWRTWWFIAMLLMAMALGIYAWIYTLRSHIRSQKILTYFATSLYGQNTVDDVFWDIARNCIGQLQFEDCVIYQVDEERQLLLQRAAFGPKSPKEHELLNPLEIPIGAGIVGHVALYGKAEIVKDTSRDKRYIVDDNRRNSEMAVPILVDGKVFGVIDSEHSRKGFYTRRHLQLLSRIAEIAAAKISKYLIEERIRLKIARDLHDEMGSTLTSINIISKMAIGQAKADPGLTSQLEKIREHSARMMDSMSDIVWAINPSNDSFEKVILRMKEFTAEILEPAGINYYFREEPQIAALPLSVEKRKELYMLFKEAITNAAKYSGATEINISFRLEGEAIVLTIMDNGRGFDQALVEEGNGLRNMRNRAMQMKAELRIESIPATGTSIHVTVPIT